MNKHRIITTSWDDGYPADYRLAELLLKYNLPGTFYLPKCNAEHEVMGECQMTELSAHFEIGGHTINHVRISDTSTQVFETEIKGCYHWLTELLGKEPESFCFPRGVYNQEAVVYAFKTGFKVIRNTELLNPNLSKSSEVVPTTLQLYPHSSLTYFKHLVKRLKIRSLGVYLRSGMKSNLLQLVDYYLAYVAQHGGCFHLWGHSWELEQYNLWDELEAVFRIISNRSEFEYMQNRELGLN